MKLTVSLFEDSNVPKAEVVCSVIPARTIPSTFHGMLLLIPIDGVFVSVRVTLTQT